MANLRILCVLIVLAAVSWQANSWGTKSWSVEAWNGGALNFHCGQHGVLMISQLYTGRKRGRKVYWINGGSCTNGMRRKAIDKCNWQSGCNLDSRWLASQSGCRTKGHFCVKLSYKCTHLTVKRGGWGQCGRGWRLHVTPYTILQGQRKHVNHMPAWYQKIWNTWTKKCNGKRRCDFQPRIWPYARITCLPYDLNVV